ncbi:MAG: DUF4242 domain-containing protein [Burkholderiaceae bacterium]|nr:DUF4242 domain-containing protein [Burkholderiaceae bacterium]
MGTFVTIRELPGVTAAEIAGAGVAIKSCTTAMQCEGTPVRWLRSFFLPGSSRTHCYFEAPSIDAVRLANERANIPYVEIVEVQELTPETV